MVLILSKVTDFNELYKELNRHLKKDREISSGKKEKCFGAIKWEKDPIECQKTIRRE